MIKLEQLKALSIATVLLALFSCQAPPKLNVSSSVPARIEKNGVLACYSTPEASCKIHGSYRAGAFDECLGGGNTRLEAFPLDPETGFKQSKTVTSYCDQNLSVFFDMSSGGIINTIARNPESDNLSNHSISETLELLQSLKKKGLISNDEYKAKKAEVLNNIK